MGNPMDRTDHDYRPVLASFNLTTLEDHRHIADMIFLYKIVNGLISCPNLLALVMFNAPVRYLRSRPLFSSSIPNYRYYAYDPVNRAMSIANQFFSGLDPFLGSLNSFRTQLCRLVMIQHGGI